jgi:hypothetical protein
MVFVLHDHKNHNKKLKYLARSRRKRSVGNKAAYLVSLMAARIIQQASVAEFTS